MNMLYDYLASNTFRMEELLPSISGSLNKNNSAEAQSIRQLPDFVIQNTEDGSLSYLEVKYRNNGIFKRSDLQKDFKYTNAFFIIVLYVFKPKWNNLML